MRRPDLNPVKPKAAHRIWWQATPDGLAGHLVVDDLIYSGLWRMSFREACRLVDHRKFPLPINTPFHLPQRIKNVQTDDGGIYPMYTIRKAGSPEFCQLSKPSERELNEVAERKFYGSLLVVAGLPRNIAAPWFAVKA